ncbi:hypothetical protein FA15DRAFT_222422 [Coprinopsis marcescibilis]|uniref:Nephrocystin 3-like N-terminal domain-containing protein n=1 Tax=Coprinopsis marcescibilis TaxID=230819 RepID=A0A5C3KG56_COPMA|nr:hypothetical protein FA15DRAFT_222422 [Coprinopsis marcescibilis]
MSRRWMGIPVPKWRLPRRRERHHDGDTNGESEGTSGNADQTISGRSDTPACLELETAPIPPKKTGRIQQPMGQQPDDRPQRTDLAPESSRSPPVKAELPPPDHRGIHDQSAGNIHGPASMFSHAQGTQINDGHFFAAKNIFFNPSKEVARGKKLMLNNIASSALYNSQERFDPPKCEENTRVGLLSAMRTWIEDRSSTSARLQCITGSAGMGKSALVQTTAEQCEPAGLVAATFFFSASDPTRNNLQSFIPTIAYQIALSNKSDPALGNCIFCAVDRDPSIFKRSIECQLEELIIKPLRETFPQGYVELFSSPSFPHLISIDGLDECVDRKSQTQLLRIISTMFINNRLPFKILLASRPERPLQAAILGDSGYMKTKTQVINLNDYDASADIKIFLQTELRTIGQESDDPRVHTDWPPPEDIDTLVVAAAGLFVYASTVIRFISQRHRRPCFQLETVIKVIKHSNPTGRAVPVRKHPFAELDTLYRNIFVFAQKEHASQYDDDDPFAVIRVVRMFSLPLPCIELSVVYSNPSSALGAESIDGGHSYGIGSRNKSVAEMEDIFQVEPGQLKSMFSDLQSLYTMTQGEFNGNAMLIPYHKSVQDFLLNPARCGEDLYIPDYTVVGRWTTVILGILAKASDSMLTGSEDDWGSTFDSSRLRWSRTLWWAAFEMTYQVPLPSASNEDAHWQVIMKEWHRIYKPFTDRGLFTRLARYLVRGATTAPRSLQHLFSRTFGLVLGFMLYEAPRLAGSEWDPGVRQDLQELFDAINEQQLASGRASEGELSALREGEPVSRDYLRYWLAVMLYKPIGNIYPWPGETAGFKLRLRRVEVGHRDEENNKTA